MTPNIVHRVVDSGNGFDFQIAAKSVGHAAAQARKLIAYQTRGKFKPWQSDCTTGGWKGVSIEPINCRHVNAGRPTPRPQRQLPWKQKQAA